MSLRSPARTVGLGDKWRSRRRHRRGGAGFTAGAEAEAGSTGGAATFPRWIPLDIARRIERDPPRRGPDGGPGVGPDVGLERRTGRRPRASGTASPVRPSASLEAPDTAAPGTRQGFLPFRPIRIGDGSEPLTPSHRHRREHHDRGSCTQPPDADPHRARRRRPRSRCRPRCDGGRLRARARAENRDAPLIPAGSPSTGGSAAALSATPSPRRPTGLSGCHRNR